MEKKPKFRSRKLDYSKPLTVYRYDEILDANEEELSSRIVPLISTGVDKEEEEEHHLQAAISGAHTNAQQKIIPTPDACVTPLASQIYEANYNRPKTLIKFSTLADDSLASSCNQYFMDLEDAKFLKQLKRFDEDLFETIIGRFEEVAEISGVQSVDSSTLTEFEQVPLETLVKILDYWKDKRMRTRGKLLPRLRFEPLSKQTDPFVCFRKRELKLQQRKTRRSDNQSLEKLRRLQYDLEAIKSLLEGILKRDKIKKESLLAEEEMFQKALQLESWSVEFNVQLRLIPSVAKALAGPLFLKQKKRSLETPVAEAYISSKMPPIIEQFANPDDLVRKDFNRSQYARDMMKRIKFDLERRIALDREFDDRTAAFGSNFGSVSNGSVLCSRFDRLGRMFIEKMNPIQETVRSTFQLENFRSNRLFMNAGELAQLNNTKVLNYNQHSVQCANLLKKSATNYSSSVLLPSTPKKLKRKQDSDSDSKE